MIFIFFRTDFISVHFLLGPFTRPHIDTRIVLLKFNLALLLYLKYTP